MRANPSVRANPAGGTAFDHVLAVADAIVYEGYLLYPYRRSAIKNRFRWQFGVLVPRAWAEARGLDDTGVAGSAEGWWQRTECLLEPAGAVEDVVVRCRVRFLQTLSRAVEERLPDGTHRPADGLEIGARLALSFDEASPRDFDLDVPVGDVLAGERRFDLRAPGGADVETLTDDAGRPAGRVLLRRWPIAAAVAVSAARCDSGLVRLPVQVENMDRTTPPDAPRPEALRRSLIATHSLLAAEGASFVSLLDPPEWAAAEARACSNVHTFPVLAGEPGRADLVLSSPILLYDHPRIAPESPGDLHDATEIDELLSLRTLTLTEEEKREARATDPRTAAIVDRVDTMPPEVMSRLHGAIRSLGPATAGTAHTTPPPAADTTPAPAADATAACATATRRRSAAGDETATPGAADATAAYATAARPGAGDAARGPAPGPDEATVAADAGATGAGLPSRWVPPRDPGGDGAIVVAGRRVLAGDRVRLRPRRRGTDPQDMFVDGRTARVEAVLRDVDGSAHLAVTLEGDPGAELDRWYGRFRYFSPAEVEPLADPPAGQGAGPAAGSGSAG